MHGASLDWIESYLSNQSQQVKVKNKISEPPFIKNDIPQGSIIGLFSVDIIDSFILKKNEPGTLILYADDSTCVFPAHSIDIALTQRTIHMYYPQLTPSKQT